MGSNYRNAEYIVAQKEPGNAISHEPIKRVVYCAICGEPAIAHYLNASTLMSSDMLDFQDIDSVESYLSNMAGDMKATIPVLNEVAKKECEEKGISKLVIYLNGAEMDFYNFDESAESCPACNPKTDKDKKIRENLITRFLIQDNTINDETGVYTIPSDNDKLVSFIKLDEQTFNKLSAISTIYALQNKLLSPAEIITKSIDKSCEKLIDAVEKSGDKASIDMINAVLKNNGCLIEGYFND